jgi:uncharacterized membrane protein
MFNVFKKPYPFNDDLKYNAKIIFFTSLAVFVFLFLFQPFNISALPAKPKYYLLGGFAVVTFLSLSFNLLFLPAFFPKLFESSRWNIRKEILWDVWVLFTILLAYFLLNNTLGVLKFGFYLVVELVLVAVVPISMLIVLNHNKMLRSHLKVADELSKKLKEHKTIQDKIVYFNSDYQKDSLAVKVNLLLFIRSANNYIEIFWKEGEIVKNQMVRCSLLYAEELLKEYKFIFKCHRSFLININYIDRIEGNSQGYKLFFENVHFSIPVSKTSVEKLQELI